MGAGIIAAMAVMFLAGVLGRFELITLGFRLRYVSDTRPSPLFVHIDINDDALRRIHAWPWPRHLHAQLSV